MLEDGIYNLLTNHEPLKALISDRVSFVLLPKTPVLPAVVMFNVSEATDVCLDKTATTARSIEIDFWVLSYSAAKAGQKVLHDLLDGYSGTLSEGTRVLEVSSDDNPDFYESDTLYYRASTTFVFQT